MANPFGIEPGMTPPSGMATYHVILHYVPKPHPAFKSYTGIWKPEHGLVRISGSSDRFTDDSTASSARRLYDQTKRQLTKLYGNPENDELVSGELWSSDKDFCSSLGNGERTHASTWERGSHAIGDVLQKILLMVMSDDGYEASSVSLVYYLPGHEDEITGDEYGLDSL